MNTLRFYTKRVFIVVCILFFGFLILIASKSSSIDELDQSWPLGRGIQSYPRRFPPIKVKAGEQMAFQPQPAPLLNAPMVAYEELGVQKQFDNEVAERLFMHIRSLNLTDEIQRECRLNNTLADYWFKKSGKTVPRRDTWERFYSQIGTCDLYHDTGIIDDLLKDLNTLEIRNVQIMDGGTQVKLIFTFENDKQAVFKPMRYGRDYETDPNHFYFGDFERHNAEIATFHLDKVLGFRRAVPTVGRVVNMTKELRDKADKKLKKTFFVSPAKNHCFVGKCDYYCDTTHAICGAPDLKEGSVQVFLPDDSSVPRKHNKSPYRRTYSKKTQVALWQQDMRYCQWKVKTDKQYAHGRRLLDLIDLHIMDYLIGNQDRHHYESFNVFENTPAYAIHLDNGRSFGRTDFDDDDILMPLRQCCIIKPSTLNTLLTYYNGPVSLTKALHESMSKDPIMPVLAYKHYPAIERRLHKIMKYLLECFDKKSSTDKIVIGEFHNPLIPNTEDNDEEEAPTATKKVQKASIQNAIEAPQPQPEDNNNDNLPV